MTKRITLAVAVAIAAVSLTACKATVTGPVQISCPDNVGTAGGTCSVVVPPSPVSTESAPSSSTVSTTSSPVATSATTPATATPTTAASSGTSLSGPVTWYGAIDNDPAGSTAIAHPCIHNQAGGTGTFADPITFATEYGSTYAYCGKIYVPRFRQYFIREDDCVCSNAANHVELWMNSSGTDSGVLPCEDTMTPAANVTIVKNPDDSRPVDTTLMYPPYYTRTY